MTRIDRRATLSLAVLAAALLGSAVTIPAWAGAKKQTAAAAPGATLQEAGLKFESARLLSDADRTAGLEEALRITQRAIQHGPDDEKAAARFLSAEIRCGLGRYGEASDEFRRAEDGFRKTPFADDAAFAAIQAIEAVPGRDVEAAKAWVEWEGRYPQSPLMGEARLSEAWNALRRGDPGAAQKSLAALTASRVWYTTDPRVVLAQATVLYQRGKPAEALAALGPKPSGAPAIYLRALCLRASGSLLRAAASFQDVADRYPDSSLHDDALLAKADAFLQAKDYRSAAEEFARTADRVKDDKVRAEAELRSAGAIYLAGQVDSSLALLRGIVERRAGTDVAARAQFLIGESLFGKKMYAEAIVELNRVLTTYFQHSVAASAQYRVARCLDALGRRGDATGTYQAVVSGYPLEPESPAAAYLAGVGLLSQNKPLAAAPYFQIVLDRYATRSDSTSTLTFASPELAGLVDAALCLLEYTYHKAGDIGQLAGAPHLLLQRMPPSRSPWRAWALLIDADASAASGKYAEAQATLERLTRDFPNQPIGASATKLLAWTYARQGRDSLAVASEEKLVAQFGASGDASVVSGALLDIARYRFNQKRYRDAAMSYDLFLKRFPTHPDRLSARYQAGLCYSRLNRAGDAVDQWEAVVRDSASAPIAEKAWARAGDLYFQAQRYTEAKRCYAGLLEHFASTDGAALATLRLAQCEYNAGNDAAALAGYAKTQEQYPNTPAAREAKRGTELSLYRLGQSAKGTEVLQTLIEKYPSSAFAADAQFQLAKRHYQAKEFPAAAEGFRKVVSQFPGYSAADQAQFLLGDSYVQAGSAPEARLAYEQFLSFFPESDLRSTVEFRLGLMEFESKEYSRAAVAFTRVLEESVSTEMGSASRYNLALCQKLLGQTDEARASLEKFRADHPRDSRSADVNFQLGDMDEAAGNMAGAEKNFEAALAASPSKGLEVEAEYRLGRCREALGNPDGALKAYLQASASPERKNPFRVSALTRCAALYESRKSFSKAYDIYLDIARNAQDQELATLAKGRASQLQPNTKKR